jgi:hypothetical protein
MPAVVTKTWTDATVLTAADLNQNFADLVAYTNGNILGSDIASSSVANDRLVNQYSEFLVELRVNGGTTPTASATVPFAAVGLPGTLTTDGNSYTVISATAATTDCGHIGNTITFSVQLGSFTGANQLWVNSLGAMNVINATTLTAAGADHSPQQAPLIAPTTLTLPLVDANPSYLALFITSITAANPLSTAGSFLSVTLKLRRTNGLRSA